MEGIFHSVFMKECLSLPCCVRNMISQDQTGKILRNLSGFFPPYICGPMCHTMTKTPLTELFQKKKKSKKISQKRELSKKKKKGQSYVLNFDYLVKILTIYASLSVKFVSLNIF